VTPPTATETTAYSSQVPSSGTCAEEVASEPPLPRPKKRRPSGRNEAPVWFTEWASESNTLMLQLVNETKRKNDLLEKLIEKL